MSNNYNVEAHHQLFVELASTPAANGRFPAFVEVYKKVYQTKAHKQAINNCWRLLTDFPEMRAQISQRRADAIARLKEEAMALPIAQQAFRLEAKQDRHDKLTTVIRQRAKDPEMKGVPGGKTGIIMRRIKQIGAGESSERVEEYAVDTATLRELSNLEVEVGKETGQLVDRSDLTSDGKPMSALALESISDAELDRRIAAAAAREAASDLPE